MPSSPARPISEVDVEERKARPTGVDELDRVLGGGIVPGAVVLLAGEPGVGKSTLLLEVAHRWAERRPGPVLYVTGEESAGQVRLRAERTGNLHPEIFLAAESDLSAVLGHVDAVRPGLMIVDSVQTIAVDRGHGVAGGVTQVRAVAAALIALAKESGLPVVLVGHVTKDGSIAGPAGAGAPGRRGAAVRGRPAQHAAPGPGREEPVRAGRRGGLLRAARRRHRRACRTRRACSCTGKDVGVAGTAVTVVMEGKRPLLAEVQALVVEDRPAGAAAGGQRPGLGPAGHDRSRCWSGAAGCG